jgi:hypothetical protein
MKWFPAVAEQVRSAIARLRGWRRAVARREQRARIRYERVEEFPEQPSEATLYLAGEAPHLWAAALLCPCGCGDVIHLNLLKQERPSWSVRWHRDGTVTLVPSVWRTKGCGSHFIIRNSRIRWVRPSVLEGPPHE